MTLKEMHEEMVKDGARWMADQIDKILLESEGANQCR